MALGDLQDLSWTAIGWAAMSFFVFFLYSSKAAVMIVAKFGEEAAAVDGTWDIVLVDRDGVDA